jgi:hypothetical protein
MFWSNDLIEMDLRPHPMCDPLVVSFFKTDLIGRIANRLLFPPLSFFTLGRICSK